MGGPGRASRRRAERSSRRGRRAGGPPPTGAPSSPAHETGHAAPGTPAAPQATKQEGKGARGTYHGAGESGEPGCGARGRWRGLAGLRGDTSTDGVEGAGGTGGPGRGARGRRQGQGAVLVGGGRARAGLEIDHSERSSRVAISRAGHRRPAHTAARPIKAGHAAVEIQPGPPVPGTPAAPQAARPHACAKPRPADAGRGSPTQSGGRV